jgi:GH18 family chitinase
MPPESGKELHMPKGFMAVLVISLLSTACASHPAKPASTPSPQAEMTPTLPPPVFRVVGYLTEAAVPAVIQYDKLTQLNFAFLIPNADGSFQPLGNSWKLGLIVELAHQHGVKVLISVGGWGWDDQFEALAADPAARTLFVNGLVQLVDQYQLDGVDIDWEYPDAGASAGHFLSLMQELRQAFPALELLTAAVVALGKNAEGIPTASFSLMDYVNIMVYDGEGPNHASMQYAQDALDYWLNERGLPQDKAVLGVPFYAKPDGTPYSRIVASDPAAAVADSFKYNGSLVNYNGIPTIQQKTRLALARASGIMIWSLEMDSNDKYSLLEAINRTILSSKGTK